ncbi:MAG: hypothetical protein AAFS10_16875, partial [Myxococcota bacterium]
AAGRTVDEGLLGLMGAAAGIHAAGLLDTFLARWGDQLHALLARDGRRELWDASLNEFSRRGLELITTSPSLGDGLWGALPREVRRRAIVAHLRRDDAVSTIRTVLSRSPQDEPCLLRLQALIAGRDRKSRAAAIRAELTRIISPGLRVRRLLELARVDPAQRHTILSDAIDQEAFDSPIQEQLYARLEELDALELLRKGLEQHLCAEGLSVQRRSHLAYWLGETIERLGGEPVEALEAYRMSFQSGHERHEALLQMARLTLELGDQWDAIRCLEAFLTLSPDRELRIDAGLQLVDLYLSECPTPEEQQREYDPYIGPMHFDGGPLGQQALDLLVRLRDESRDTEREHDIIARLARAHAHVGSPYRAVELFQEILTGNPEVDNIDDALALADIYSRILGDLPNAEQILWVLFSAHPDRQDIRDALLAVVKGRGNLAVACERMESTARSAAPEVLTPSDRRAMLELVAGLYQDELGRFREAALIWGELAKGAVDPAQVRRLRVRQATALCRVSGEESQCHALMLKLHQDDPFDLEVYKGLEWLYTELSRPSRVRLIQQIRYLLDPENAREPVMDGMRRKTRPTRSFDSARLQQHLLPEGLQGGILQVLQALEPLAIKVWGDQLPTIDALGGRRWRGGDQEQLKEFTEEAMRTFGLTKTRLYLGNAGPSAPQVFGAGTSVSVWFHRGMFTDSGAEMGRFLGGYAAGLAWSGVGQLVHLDGRDLWHLLEAVLIKQSSRGLTEVTDPRSMELVDAISSPFSRSLRRRVVEVATPCMASLRTAHCEAWPAMIQEIGTRSG